MSLNHLNACTSCGHIFLPTLYACPECGARDYTSHLLPERGRVRAVSTPKAKAPVCLIAFENKAVCLATSDTQNIQIGETVELYKDGAVLKARRL